MGGLGAVAAAFTRQKFFHQKGQAPNYGRTSRFGAIFGIYVKRKKCCPEANK